MTPAQTYYQTLADTLIKNLQKRQIDGFYCPTSAEAVTLVNDMIAPDSTVSFGGSMTLSESGMMETLTSRNDITLYDRSTAKTPEEVTDIYHKALNADYYLMSTNAISTTGELVNIDGNGNRVAALIYGPKQVIILAGMNKVTPDLASAMTRAQNTAAAPNAVRLNRKTPCAATGVCHDCQSPDCICAQTVITRRGQIPNRIKVILIGEHLGY